MAVGQEYLVKIHGDRQFVVLEIPQPGTLRRDRIGQQGQDIRQWYSDHFPMGRLFGDTESDRILVRTGVNTEMI